MRIQSLTLPSFKNLQRFSISFDEDAPIAVLVGRNGTGKSNLIEALTIIFGDLDLGISTDFAYTLSYSCRGHQITLEHDPAAGSRICNIDSRELPFSRIEGEHGREYRPDHVFGYYSGPSNRLERHYEAHHQRFYRDLVRGIERPLRPLFYARAFHSNFALLAFFLEDDAVVNAFLSEQLGIVALDSVLFVLHKPSWTSKRGDPRFWRARGTVQGFLDRLFNLALAPLRLDVGKRTERLYLYLPDVQSVRSLAELYSSNQEFFKALESTYISELIADVRIRVTLERTEHPLTFRELSEGEQQLLLVLGLIRFTRENESLFLLDEPDTHLNPAWSVQYRGFLSKVGALDATAHVILATHDPLVVAGLLKDEVRILARDNSGIISAQSPTEDPRGMGVGALLTSDVYGLRSQLDLETLEKLDRKRALAAKALLDKDEEVELHLLSQELASLELAIEDRDREFQTYLRAKYRREEPLPDEITLSRDEIFAERRLAEEILGEQSRKR
jgi:predicted ATPase